MANENLYGGIQNAYRQYLGRDANQDELAFHANTSPNNYNDVIKGSGEAQLWSQKQSQPQQAYSPVAGQAPAAPAAAAPQRNTSANGWYTEGAKTYDQNGLLQGDTGYNRAAIAQALYDIQTSAGRGNDFNLDNWLSGHQDIARGASSGKGGEYLVLPGGGQYDIRRGFDQGSGRGDVVSFGAAGDPGDAGGGNMSGAGGMGAGSGGGGGSSSSFSSSGGGNGNMSAQQQALFDTLMARSKQSLNIDAQTDPNIRQQADPYAAAMTRANRDNLSQLAESFGPYANMQGEVRMGAEKVGQATGQFEASLVGKELTSRRDEIQNALSGMQGMLSQDQQIALQRELAAVNESLSRAQMAQQNAQFGSSQALDRDKFAANLGFQTADRSAYYDALRSGQLG